MVREYKKYIFICVPKMNISLIGLQCYVAAEGQHIVVNAGSFFSILILLFSASQICPGDPTALFEVPRTDFRSTALIGLQ